MDRWDVINILFYPRDPKTGWPVTEKVESKKPDRVNGDPYEGFLYDMTRFGVREWAIRPEFERRREAKRVKKEQDKLIAAELMAAMRNAR